jgi:hypothetical protein
MAEEQLKVQEFMSMDSQKKIQELTSELKRVGVRA